MYYIVAGYKHYYGTCKTSPDIQVFGIFSTIEECKVFILSESHNHLLQPFLNCYKIHNGYCWIHQLKENSFTYGAYITQPPTETIVEL